MHHSATLARLTADNFFMKEIAVKNISLIGKVNQQYHNASLMFYN